MTNGNVIGYVSKQSGEATLTKINGEVVELGIFSQIHKNDLIESVDGTSIEVVMTNGNVVNIDGQRTLLIDETVYEAKSFKQDEVSKESVEAVEKGDISQLEATEAGEQKVGTSQNISDAFTNRGVDDGFAQAEGLLIGLETSLADTNPDELEEDQIDSLSPNAPFINPIALGNDDTPTITGKAEADSEVSIIIDGKVVDVVIADGNGDWSYTTDTLSDGEHLVSAISTDATGNSREASENTSFIIDTQAPDSPIINELGSTNDTTPTLTGEGEVGSTIVISINSEIVGETTVAENGQWTYTLEDVLREGDYAISATSTDKAGNTSYASITSVITIVISCSISLIVTTKLVSTSLSKIPYKVTSLRLVWKSFSIPLSGLIPSILTRTPALSLSLSRRVVSLLTVTGARTLVFPLISVTLPVNVKSPSTRVLKSTVSLQLPVESAVPS